MKAGLILASAAVIALAVPAPSSRAAVATSGTAPVADIWAPIVDKTRMGGGFRGGGFRAMGGGFRGFGGGFRGFGGVRGGFAGVRTFGPGVRGYGFRAVQPYAFRGAAFAPRRFYGARFYGPRRFVGARFAGGRWWDGRRVWWNNRWWWAPVGAAVATAPLWYNWYNSPSYYGYAYGGDCEWLRQRASITGSEYWWNRYSDCIYGN